MEINEIKEIVEKYITFAIKNNLNVYGNNITKYKVNSGRVNIFIRLSSIDDYFDFNFIELITSIEFIEAISLGLYEKNRGSNKNFIRMGIGSYTAATYYDDPRDQKICLNEIKEALTLAQSIAIRDKYIFDFIINILNT